MTKHIECEHCSEDKYLYKTSIGWLCAEHAASLLDEKVSRVREVEAANAALVDNAMNVTRERDELAYLYTNASMALYDIDPKTFGPLTARDGIVELKRQLEQAQRMLDLARAELHFFHNAFPQATKQYRALSELESETPLGQQLDDVGDEAQS